MRVRSATVSGNHNKKIFLRKNFQGHLANSRILAGERDDMCRRAIILYHIYCDSGKRLEFALVIAYMTLVIESTSYSPYLLSFLQKIGCRKLAVQWKEWGELLRKLNKLFFEQFVHCYYWTKEAASLNFNPESDEAMEMFLDEGFDISALSAVIPTLMNIHYSKINNIQDNELQDKSYEILLKWEHHHVIQPKLLFFSRKLSPIWRLLLKNIPGSVIEKIFLWPFFRIRTSFSLSFDSNWKRFRTKNFLDHRQRMDQSRQFYYFLKTQDLDPEGQFFRSDFYVSELPEAFFASPETFSENFTCEILRGRKESITPVPEAVSSKINSLSDPAARNRFITEQYQLIAEEIRAITGTSAANWYDFAKWASISCGEMIKMTKYEEISTTDKLLFRRSPRSAWKLRSKMIETNTDIGLWMIRIGWKFIGIYKSNDQSDVDGFFKELGNRSNFEKLLKTAFIHYKKAVSAITKKEKESEVKLASIYQVLSEQVRIDDNIKYLFSYNGSILKKVFLYRMTRNGNLKIGNNKIIELTKDIRLPVEFIFEDHSSEEWQILLNDHGLKIGKEHVKNSACKDWSNLQLRQKFLVAFFMCHSNDPAILATSNLNY